ncbi:MAG: hypothetical protein HY548_08575, partial [Elusimicrobia bacterium]|nr:hypothetical protein [Elusimicrobiota bacterium]
MPLIENGVVYPSAFKSLSCRIAYLIESLPHIRLPDSFAFGVASGTLGQKLLSEDEFKASQAAEAPTAPPIQEYLALAYQLKKRLDADQNLTHGVLAQELGLCRFEIIRTLKLLKLAPRIQQFIRELPVTKVGRYPISKRNLRSLLRTQDYDQQTKAFKRLVSATPLASLWNSSPRLAPSITHPTIAGRPESIPLPQEAVKGTECPGSGWPGGISHADTRRQSRRAAS